MMKRILGVALLGACVLGFAFASVVVGQEGAKPAKPAMVTKAYSVRDLTTPPRGLEAPPQHDAEGGETREGMSEEEMLEDLIHLIKDTIAIDTWDEDDAAIRGRQGVIVVTHTEDVQAKIKALLDETRKLQGRIVVTRIRFVTPKPEDVERIIEGKLSLARTPDEKDKLLKLCGKTVSEARFVATEGERVPLETTEKPPAPAHDQEDAHRAKASISGWVLCGVTPDDSVRLDTDVTYTRPEGRASLTVSGNYRIPDGGMLFASGATLAGGDGKQEVYALIDVQVLPRPEAPRPEKEDKP